MTKPNNTTLDAYCTSGTSPTFKLIGPRHAPTILVLGGISAKPDLDWWKTLVGPHQTIDTNRFQVLSTEWLTSEGVTTHDQAKLILDILDQHNIDTLHAAIGCSYGGMVALALGELAPTRVQQIISIAAAHRPHPLASAWRWLQRQVASLGAPQEGLALARALAMTTYRSDRELDARFSEDPSALESWLEHHGKAFTQRFSRDAFIALSGAIDRHRVDPELITTPTTIVGFDSDLLAPSWLLRELVDALPCAEHYELQTLYGHDGFLKEVDSLAPILRRALQKDVEVAA